MWLHHFTTALLLILTASVSFSQEVAPSVLIVLVVDASKSALPVPKPTVGQLKEIDSLVNNRKTGGTLAFAVIGNPKPENRHFYRYNIDPVPVAKPGATLKIRAEIGRNARQIKTDNRQRVNSWLPLYQQILLQYKPNGPELSNVDEVFTRAVLLLREPPYQNHQKILVFCSDLKNEPNRSNVVVPWSINLNGISQLTVVGTGASYPNPFTKLPNYVVLSDVDGLVPTLQIILNR